MKGWNWCGNIGRTGVLIAPVLLAGCNLSPVKTTSPINSSRGVEVLEMPSGEIPQWKKKGNLSVNPKGDIVTAAVTVRDNNSTQTIAGRGREIRVVCNDSKLTIIGGCSKLVVSGEGNVLTCDFVDEISITGEGNRVNCDSVVSGVITGSGNIVGWRQPTNDARPQIEYQGINNLLERIE